MSVNYQNELLPVNEKFEQLDYADYIKDFEEKYNDMLSALNHKDYGLYTTDFTLCGQTRFDRTNLQNVKDVIRKVIDFGALPNNALKQVAHGITVDANTEFTRIYAVANDPGTSAIQIAHPMILEVDATNINITTVDDKTAYTVCTVTVEYIGG